MFRSLKNRMAESSLLQNVIHTPSPRWVILLIDMFIVALSCLLTFTFSITPDQQSHHLLNSPLSVTAVVVLVYFV
ncbi:MAG: hypothetical protein K2L81_04035, partial [Muribaculaceae bacterium]|nr:hypothetical protein [Muribaculaceae bacterium]